MTLSLVMELPALRCERVRQGSTVYTQEREGKLHSCSSMSTFNLSTRHASEIIDVPSAVFKIKSSIHVNIQVITWIHRMMGDFLNIETFKSFPEKYHRYC